MSAKKKDLNIEKIPPQNIDAEKALLGCMLIDEEARIRVFETLKKDFFYSSSHQQIFSSIIKLYERNEKCDIITLTNQLKQDGTLDEIGGVEYITEIAEFVPTSAHIEEYIKIVKDQYILRSLISNATQIITEASNGVEDVERLLDKAESLIFEISQNKIDRYAYPLKDLIKENLDIIENIQNKKGFVTGISTGYFDLDKYIGGLHPSELIIIASRPSMGKTALATNIALNLAASGDNFPILFFSLEMSKEQLVGRMLCCEARIDYKKLRDGILSDKEITKLLLSAGRLEKAPIFIDDAPSLNVFELRARARRLKAKENIQLIIIDYLQLMKGVRRTENRQQEITEISASLKSLARELNIPVIAISQLSRATEQREDKKPHLSDLRESGSIEQDADVVLLLYRDDYYKKEDSEKPGIVDLIIAKQRNGPTETVNLTFIKEYTRFENYTKRE
ncbi:MAG TPA: replicative DNA helicase [Candidatus Ratteibacteria bacterium]|nr:replicative DNA helicase [bacterium]HRR95124.1 replicative DNA helicase [Candidatus Ratteibacteria bacterium]